MVGIVAEEDELVSLDLEVEATVYTTVCLHTVFQFTCCTTIELSHGHGSNTVFYVDGNRLTKLYAFYTLDGRDEVEGNLTIVDANVLSMEIALVEAIVIALYAILQMLWVESAFTQLTPTPCRPPDTL